VNEVKRHKTELKHKFKQDFNKVQEFVNEFDPCGLIYTGAPIDEYDCLTHQLLSAVYNGKTRIEIKDLILHEIEHHFGTLDLETLKEPYKTIFYNNLETLIDNLGSEI
jgi:effector-binding domain-containing protein